MVSNSVVRNTIQQLELSAFCFYMKNCNVVVSHVKLETCNFMPSFLQEKHCFLSSFLM